MPFWTIRVHASFAVTQGVTGCAPTGVRNNLYNVITYLEGYMKTAFFVVICAVLAACSSTTGIVPIGNGIYMSSKQDYSLNWHGGKVKAELYKEAAQFCAAKGKSSVPQIGRAHV